MYLLVTLPRALMPSAFTARCSLSLPGRLASQVLGTCRDSGPSGLGSKDLDFTWFPRLLLRDWHHLVPVLFSGDKWAVVMPPGCLGVWAVVPPALESLTSLAFKSLLKGQGWEKPCLVASTHGKCQEAGDWINAGLEHSSPVSQRHLSPTCCLKGFNWKYLPCLSLQGLGGNGRASRHISQSKKTPFSTTCLCEL